MAPALEIQGGEIASQNNGLNSVNDVTNRSKVTVIGSGNWGSVAYKLIASNTIRMNNFDGNFLVISWETSEKCEIHRNRVNLESNMRNEWWKLGMAEAE
jgi:hypothetical protein